MKNGLLLAFVGCLLLSAQDASAQIELTFSFVEPTCYGYTNGAATVSPTGGTAPYSYQWENGQSGQTNSGIGVGVYAVTVSDSDDETIIGTVTITEPDSLFAEIIVTNIPCSYDSLGGAASVLISNGTSPYSILWNDGDTSDIRQNLPAGSYSVTITDSHDCTAVGQGTILSPPPLEVIVAALSPSCGASNNGRATVLASGGTPPYTHTWTPGGYSSATVTDLAPGQYYVSTFDANNCQKNLWVIIPEITSLDVSLTVLSATCTGVDDGVVKAFVDPPGIYEYEWNLPPYQGVTELTGLAANTVVSVTVTDPVSGCTGTATVVVSGHSSINITVTDTDIPCAGINNGSANANAFGGTPAYQYTWMLPPSDTIGFGPTISNLGPGAYLVSVTDSQGCTAISGANIGVESDPVPIIKGATILECGALESTIQFENLSTDAFGTIVSWEWTITTPTDTFTFLNISPVQLVLPVGTVGIATLVITSAKGCVADTTKAFTVPGIPDISLNTGPVAIDCDNGPIKLIVNGGLPSYTYEWTPLTGLSLDSVPPNATANPSITTTYQLIASDQGCLDTVSVTVVRVTDTLELSVDQSLINTCDSTVLLSATSNVNDVVWIDALGNVLGNPPTNPITVLFPGDTSVFTVIATDLNGCMDSLPVTVVGHGIDVAVDPNLPDTLCANAEIQLSLINNNPGDTLEYNWVASPPLVITGANTANPIIMGPVGSYNVTVTVSNQFACADTLIIPLHFAEMVPLGDVIAVDLCDGTTVSFFNYSGLLGLWDFGDGDTITLVNPVHNYDTAGLYNVTFTPSNLLCSQPWDSTIIVRDSALAAPLITYAYINCVDTAQIQFSGTSTNPNLSWQWTFSAGTPDSSSLQNPVISFSEEGTIAATLFIQDSFGCTATTTLDLDIWIIQDFIPDSLMFCAGDSVQLNADGFDSTATYMWTSNPVDPNLNAGEPNPWVAPLLETIYTVSISEDTFCSVSYQVTVIPLSGPDVETDFQDTLCAEVPTQLSLINNNPGDILQYVWTVDLPAVITGGDTDTPTISGPAGDYNITVTVTNQFNCSQTLIIPIFFQEAFDIGDSISVDLCDGLNVHFFNNSGLSGQWNFGDGDSSVLSNPIHIYDSAGLYHVTFTPDSLFCAMPWDSILNVQDVTLEILDIAYAYINCVDSAQIQFSGSANNPNVSWHWTFSAGNPGSSILQNPVIIFTVEDTIKAVLIVTDPNGCTDTAMLDVPVWIIQDFIPDSLMFCPGDSVQLNGDGFDPTATYLWTSVPVDMDLNSMEPNPWVAPLVETVYTVNISQDTFCSVSYQVTVYPLSGPDVTQNFPDTICAGIPSQLSLINNNPGDTLQYVWMVTPPGVITGADTDMPIISGPTGDYIITVTVTNQFYCSQTLIIPIFIQEAINIQDSITVDLCDGLTVSFFNNSGYSGIWDFGDSTNSLLLNPVHVYDTAGLYHVTFTPASLSCILPWDSVLNVQDLALDSTGIAYNYINCVDSALIQFSGSSNNPNVSWLWTFSAGSPGSSTLQNPVITFTVEDTISAMLLVTDINGCTDTANLDVPIWIIQDMIPDSLMFCLGDSVQLNADGYDLTATYIWTSIPADPNLNAGEPNPWVAPLVETIYTVSISQDTFCSVNYEVTVTPLSGPDVTPNITDTICVGVPVQMGLINNNPGDTLQYEWTVDPPLEISGGNTDSPTIVGPSGNYDITVTVTNQNNCALTLVIPIYLEEVFDLQDSILVDLCDGLSVSFFNNSGWPGLWNFGDGETSTLPNPIHVYDTAGLFHVIFTPDNLSCTLPWDSVLNVQDMALDSTGIAYEYINCVDSAQLQFSGTSNNPNVSWFWTFSAGTPGSSTLQNPVITFTEEDTIGAVLVVTDINGCTDTATLDVPIWIIQDAIPDTLRYCLGDSIQLNADGFDSTATYFWTSMPVDPSLDAAAPDPWVSPEVETIYTVTINQDTLCDVTYQVIVIPKAAAFLELPPDMVVCNDSLLTITVSGNGISFEWSESPTFEPIFGTGATVEIIPVKNGIYYVRTQTLDGCSAFDSIIINNGAIAIEPGPFDNDICLGESTTLVINNLDIDQILTYNWTPTLPNVSNPSVSPTEETTYHVEISNQFGCTAELDFQLNVTEVEVIAEITGNDTICVKGLTTLLATPFGNGAPYTFEWSPSSSLNDSSIPDPVATPKSGQVYVVTVTTENGCTATDEVEVYFCDEQCLEPYIFVPKAFTPNNDSNNDYFMVRGASITDLLFIVWDRWGEKMYETTDPDAQGWDGTFNGKALTPDSYAWYVQIRCGDGGFYENKGNVTLLK